MRNIGSKSSAWLHAVGISGLEDLRRIGALEAFLRVKWAGFNASLNLLWALDGALNDCPWNRLPAGGREALLLALHEAERA